MERETVLAFAVAVGGGADALVERLELAVAEVRRTGAQEWYRLAEVRTLAKPTFDERDALAAFSGRLSALQSPGAVRLVTVGATKRALPFLIGRAMAWRIPLPAVCDALAVPAQGFSGPTLCHIDLEVELGPAGLRAAIPSAWRAQVTGQPPHGCAALSALVLYMRWQLARGAIGVRSFERSTQAAVELLSSLGKRDVEVAKWIASWLGAARSRGTCTAASEGHGVAPGVPNSRGPRRQWRLPGIVDTNPDA